MAWKATHKYARISARKVRLVADLIRDRDVPVALDILAFTHQRAARMVEKVLLSAVANADDQGEVDADDLFIAIARVDEGPTIDRWRPKDRGRAHPIRKRTCHIRIEVAAVYMNKYPAFVADKFYSAWSIAGADHLHSVGVFAFESEIEKGVKQAAVGPFTLGLQFDGRGIVCAFT